MSRCDYAPRVHFRKPSKAGTQHDHWTVCGLFRGDYQHTRIKTEVSCGHCLRWIELHP